MTNKIINNEGLSISENFIISCERVGNNSQGHPKYQLKVFNKNGRNVGYELREKINYKLLKGNKFTVISFNIGSVIADLIDNLEN